MWILPPFQGHLGAFIVPLFLLVPRCRSRCLVPINVNGERRGPGDAGADAALEIEVEDRFMFIRMLEMRMRKRREERGGRGIWAGIRIRRGGRGAVHQDDGRGRSFKRAKNNSTNGIGVILYRAKPSRGRHVAVQRRRKILAEAPPKKPKFRQLLALSTISNVNFY
ncbi:hypothetical protein C8J57DRAFT_1251954 [Mycena rebaudengoi]|nr:hypothetical protein C8J57DRAFT_1251954 [Mycena rebaudengoi]